MPRILTYNVHRCVGTDRKLDVARVADVIAAQEPDIVALQELDVGRMRTDHVFVSRDIAVTAAFAPYDPLTRAASDHLPLVIDFETVPASASRKGLEPAASERI